MILVYAANMPACPFVRGDRVPDRAFTEEERA